MFTLTALLATALVAIQPGTPPAESPLAAEDLSWRISGNDGSSLHMMRGRHGRAMIPLAAAPQLAEAVRRDAAGPIRFVVSRGAGTFSCHGILAARLGRGSCRFVGNRAFERGLAARGFSPRSRDGLIAMAMVDVTLARADGLRAAGIVPDDADGVFAATVFGIGGADARALTAALDAGARR